MVCYLNLISFSQLILLLLFSLYLTLLFHFALRIHIHIQSMAPENAFRQQLSSWNTRPPARAPFAEWTDYVRNTTSDLYLSLPSYNTATTTEEPQWFRLSRLEKLVGFACCLAGSVLCFVTCFFLFPVLALKPRKFAMLWSLGSVLFVVSFGVLQGPYNYAKHLVSRDRIVFTTVFFSSVIWTMYAATVRKSTIMTIVASAVEMLAIIYYTVSYFPFGALTLTFFGSYVVGYIGGFLGGLI